MTRTDILTKLQSATPAQLDTMYVALIGYPPIAECGEDPESVRAILTEAAEEFAAEAAEAGRVAFVVPADPLTDIDKVLDGDAICERSAARQEDAQYARDEARDCNGNARVWE